MATFDPNNQTAAEQARRFGFNNDMVALFSDPIGAPGQLGGRLPFPSYIMCVNNEYATGRHQFPDYPVPSTDTANFVASAARLPTKNQVDVQIESVGVSVVKVNLTDNRWRPDLTSRFNRRITMTTPISINGPARGDTLMQTPGDPSGTTVLGTFANCGGGLTPWGTYLSCEENFDGLFNNLAAVTVRGAKALAKVPGASN